MAINFLLLIFLISQIQITIEINCDQITPSSPADCKLSSSDKERIFPNILCCYEKNPLTGKFQCEPYSEITLDFKEDECYNETNSNLASGSCEFINPKKASDCVLSERDKKKYDYCCYTVLDDVKLCSLETEDSIEDSKSFAKLMHVTFECGNKSEFINLSIIFLISLILFL